MSANPKSAIDSILSPETKIEGLTVYPISIGRYALLELVDSPFINVETKFNISNIVPTLYIMTRSNDELKKYSSRNIDKLIDQSYEWSNEVSMDVISGVLTETQKQFELLNKVTPDGEGTDGKKK